MLPPIGLSKLSETITNVTSPPLLKLNLWSGQKVTPLTWRCIGQNNEKLTYFESAQNPVYLWVSTLSICPIVPCSHALVNTYCPILWILHPMLTVASEDRLFSRVYCNRTILRTCTQWPWSADPPPAAAVHTPLQSRARELRAQG